MFIADTVTDLEIAIGVLHVPAVLMAARLLVRSPDEVQKTAALLPLSPATAR
jgi:hypothetical protein